MQGISIATKKFCEVKVMRLNFLWLLSLISPECCIYASVNWFSIGSDNGLLPVWPQAIIVIIIIFIITIIIITMTWQTLRNKLQWNNNLLKFSFVKMHLKMSSAKWQPFCPGGDELNISSFYLYTFQPPSWYPYVMTFFASASARWRHYTYLL